MSYTSRQRRVFPRVSLHQAWGVLGLLGVSALALAAAPGLMPPSYSWLRHTTSESAAQGVAGAWLARLGFLSLGLAVVWLSSLARAAWRPLPRGLHAVFGLCLVAAASFSTRAWLPDLAFDPVEDALHSVVANVMGVAFALGLTLQLTTPGRGRNRRTFDAIGVLASLVIPITMSLSIEWTGALQRLMFAIAFAWYATEAHHLIQSAEVPDVA